jgi:hypothetical protein
MYFKMATIMIARACACSALLSGFSLHESISVVLSIILLEFALIRYLAFSRDIPEILDI